MKDQKKFYLLALFKKTIFFLFLFSCHHLENEKFKKENCKDDIRLSSLKEYKSEVSLLKEYQEETLNKICYNDT